MGKEHANRSQKRHRHPINTWKMFRLFSHKGNVSLNYTERPLHPSQHGNAGEARRVPHPCTPGTWEAKAGGLSWTRGNVGATDWATSQPELQWDPVPKRPKRKTDVVKMWRKKREITHSLTIVYFTVVPTLRHISEGSRASIPQRYLHSASPNSRVTASAWVCQWMDR